MNPANNPDCNIPVLTDIISIDDRAEPGFNQPRELSQIQADIPEPNSFIQTQPAKELSLEELKKTLHENVLRQLLTRIDFVLEHRVRDGLADVLQTAVDALAKDIRQGMSNSLEEVIQRAINQEISKIQSLNQASNPSHDAKN